MYVDDKTYLWNDSHKRLIISYCLREHLLLRERKGTSMTNMWTWAQDMMKTTPSSTILMLYVKFLFFNNVLEDF